MIAPIAIGRFRMISGGLILKANKATLGVVMSTLSGLQRTMLSVRSQLSRLRLYHYFALCSGSGTLPGLARRNFGLEE